MSRKPGAFRSLWNIFRKEKPVIKEDCVGVDKLGNKYFLRHADPDNNIKESRYIKPTEELEKESDGTAALYNIPQEWDAWLRKRRNIPPTPEEIEKNILQQMKMQERVRALEQRDRLESQQDEVTDNNTGMGTNSQDNKQVTQTIKGDMTRQSFPVYNDLERFPGEFHMKKGFKD